LLWGLFLPASNLIWSLIMQSSWNGGFNV
jgi:hypothetical protein